MNAYSKLYHYFVNIIGIVTSLRYGLELIQKLVDWTVNNQKIASQNAIQCQNIKNFVKILSMSIWNVVSEISYLANLNSISAFVGIAK